MSMKAGQVQGLMDLLQGLKVAPTDALVSEGAVKALDVSVLRWAAGLDQDVFGAIFEPKS